MASVQHYVCEADQFPLHIIEKHATFEDIGKERHFAALKIQRLWRGYVVRKEIARWNHAATVLQKYIRRWLVKWHLPDIYHEYIDWYNKKMYNDMATKIQARWRGYWVRKNTVSPKALIEQRKMIEEANTRIQQEMNEAFTKMEDAKKQKMEEEARHWVLYILFKLHHHVRTYTREGIYSTHGEHELSDIEKLLNSLSYMEYMFFVKALYYEEIKKEKPQRQHLFKSRILRELEEIYWNRDKSREPKEAFVPDRNIHSRPFMLTSKLKEKPYKKMLYNLEKYTSKKFSFSRLTKPDKHMSNKDFDLNVLKKVIFPLEPPAYDANYWSKPCKIHDLPDM